MLINIPHFENIKRNGAWPDSDKIIRNPILIIKTQMKTKSPDTFLNICRVGGGLNIINMWGAGSILMELQTE